MSFSPLLTISIYLKQTLLLLARKKWPLHSSKKENSGRAWSKICSVTSVDWPLLRPLGRFWVQVMLILEVIFLSLAETWTVIGISTEFYRLEKPLGRCFQDQFSVLSSTRVYPENTYSCILNGLSQVWKRRERIDININYSWHQRSLP